MLVVRGDVDTTWLCPNSDWNHIMWKRIQSRCLIEGSKSEIHGFMEMEGGRAATSVEVGFVPVVFMLDVGTGGPSS